MKNLLLQLLGLIAIALKTDPNDDDRIEKVETDLAKIKEDIEKSRGDSAFADPEVQAKLDEVTALAQRAQVADEDQPTEEEQAAEDARRTAEAAGTPPASDQS